MTGKLDYNLHSISVLKIYPHDPSMLIRLNTKHYRANMSQPYIPDSTLPKRTVKHWTKHMGQPFNVNKRNHTLHLYARVITQIEVSSLICNSPRITTFLSKDAHVTTCFPNQKQHNQNHRHHLGLVECSLQPGNSLACWCPKDPAPWTTARLKPGKARHGDTEYFKGDLKVYHYRILSRSKCWKTNITSR